MKAKREAGPVSEALGGVVLGIVILLINLILTFALFLFAAYGIIPLVCDTLSLFDPDLSGQINTILYREQETVYGICSAIALFPSCMIVYRLNKDRYNRFIRDTRGKIPVKEGLYYHLKQSRISEICQAVCIAAVSPVNLLIGDSFNLTPFLTLWKLCGIPLGLLLTLLLTCMAQLVGILSAQNHWRAEYFCEE